MTNNEKQLKAVETEMARYADEIKSIWAKADEEERETTADERGEVEDHLKAIEVLKEKKSDIEQAIEVEQSVKRISRDLGPSTGVEVNGIEDVSVTPQPEPVKSLGEAFVESEGYKSIQDPANRPETWSVKGVEMPFETKGTLLSGTGSPGSGSGGGLMPVPQVAPGVVSTLFQRNVFANLLGQGQTDSNTVRYVVEGTATNAAAGVAEAGAKPESTLGLSTKDESVKKIATLLPVSEEMLEDASQVQAYINGRLTLFVQNTEDLQLIRGGGTNDLQGIIGRSGVNIYGGGTAAGNKAEQIFKALNGVRGSAFTEPEWVVVNPTDYQDLRLLKDANNQYFGGGPWLGEYGVAGAQVGSNPQVAGPIDTLWGKRVYVTSNIGAGTALAGNSADAVVYRKGGIRVDATNSHSTYFANNLVAIRAEERLALAVFRPASFVEIRLA